jgi:hypothetical protein
VIVANPRDGRNQPIAAARHVLHVSWLAAGITERHAELPHTEVQAGVEIDVRFAPQSLAYLLTRDEGAAAFDEQLQQPRGLWRQPFCVADAGLAQFTARDVELELPEPKSIRQ